jgi:hypothetical protein
VLLVGGIAPRFKELDVATGPANVLRRGSASAINANGIFDVLVANHALEGV